MVDIEASWKQHLEGEFTKPYFTQLTESVRNEYRNGLCFPPGKLVFNAFNLCPFDKVKVVILGQDPYHEQGQAMGLSFSVPDGVKLPPSLRKIYKEIEDNLCETMPESGDLTRWAEQGVLLLNTVLTVREKQANSHRKYMWRLFTDAVVKALNKEREHIVFMLWGRIAQRKERFIRTDNGRHMVLKAIHPSPLAVRRKGEWDGKEHFTCCNKYLNEHGIAPIDWMVVSEQVDE